MKLENNFVVSAAPERAWAFLLDPELVVPCMPGAELVQVLDADSWEALAKVKLGPVTMNFKGKVTLVERDDDLRRVVMTAKGTETRGKGMFNASVTAQVEQDAAGSRVVVVTDLKLSGKAASFGRGMVGDVSERLTKQFAETVESQLEAIAKLEAEAEAEPSAEKTEETARPTKKKPAKKKRAKKKAASRRPPPTLAKPPPPKPRAVGGIGLFFWAVWRALVRFFKGEAR